MFTKIVPTLLLISTLAACGTRGPLVLPPGAPPEPLLGQSASKAPDANTTKENTR